MLFRLKRLEGCARLLSGPGFTSLRARWGTSVQPQIRRLKSSGPAPGDPALGIPPEGLTSRASRPATRDFSADAARDAVIVPAGDLAAAQEAVTRARQDQEVQRRAGAAPAARDQGGPGGTGGPSRPQPPPPWGTVLLTTVRLWAQRHLPPRWPAQARWRVLTLLILAAVLFGAGAISVALARGPAPAPHARGTRAGTGRAPAPAAVRAAAAARTAAARWIAGQVSADAIVSCDPQMCALLQAQAIPAARLLVLGGSDPAPLGSDLIVSTAVVRSEFGARLASVYAPAVLASFGAGTAQTAVRVVAADGSAAYLRSLRADVAARASAGSQLLHNPRLRPSAAARRALAAGQVDSRLLTAFAALATMYRVDVAGFPRPPPGRPRACRCG